MTAREQAAVRDLVARTRLYDPEHALVACTSCGGYVTRSQLARKGGGRLRGRCKDCESDRVSAAYHRRKASGAEA